MVLCFLSSLFALHHRPDLIPKFRSKSTRTALYDMSQSVGLATGPQPHWLCPLPPPFALGDRRDTGPDTAILQLRLVPSFIPTITQLGPIETWPHRDTSLPALTGPRSDQAWREGSSSSLTSTCYDLWAESKKGPWLDLSRQCLWKLLCIGPL